MNDTGEKRGKILAAFRSAVVEILRAGAGLLQNRFWSAPATPDPLEQRAAQLERDAARMIREARALRREVERRKKKRSGGSSSKQPKATRPNAKRPKRGGGNSGGTETTPTPK
jgi:hypothetical protein